HADSTRSRQKVKIGSQTSEVLDCRLHLQASMPSHIGCQAHGRRNAVPYGRQPACSPSAAESSGAPLTGTEGSNPPPCSKESCANEVLPAIADRPRLALPATVMRSKQTT